MLNLILKYLFILPLTITVLEAQTVTNGGFASGSSGWGCSPEINSESVYGGSGSNATAEVDYLASLCQTITGLGVGNVYTISFDCSRRTGGCPSPTTTNINFVISGGALSTTVTRTNTAFGFTNSSFNFTATSTSHVINFTAGSGFGTSTCGMIIDNINITLYSALPIELTYFTLEQKDNNSVNILWETASELNNEYFTIERSQNAIEWEILSFVKGAGNSSSKIKYNFVDESPFNDISYYRLKQTDYNKKYKYSNIKSISLTNNNSVLIAPNPSTDHLLNFNSKIISQFDIVVLNNIGEKIKTFTFKNSNYGIDLTSLPPGIYYFIVYEKGSVISREKIILQ